MWASPPCTKYTKATIRITRYVNSVNEIVFETLKIIAQLNLTYCIVENPQTGLLKEQIFMDETPCKDIEYCEYGMRYRKRTRLWNNMFLVGNQNTYVK